jgi:PIN domain nuclease of toxin-antitoxin system
MSPLAFVLDSSAILAIVRGEPGADKALALARERSCTSSVNVAEVVTKCVEWQYPEAVAINVIESCGIDVVALEQDHAVLAGQLRRKARKGVLSLGDRACIATAIRMNATAVTADKVWSTLDLGCKIELIR